jgi:hypothetical protein
MFKFIKKWWEARCLQAQEIELLEKIEFEMTKKFYVVGHITAHTRWTDIGTTTHHSYVLKENGNGVRKVDVISKNEHGCAYEHQMYTKLVAPWEKGVNFKNIPSFKEIFEKTKEVGTN